MSTQLCQDFSHFKSFFASIYIGQISHQQNKGYAESSLSDQFHTNPEVDKNILAYLSILHKEGWKEGIGFYFAFSSLGLIATR